MCESGAGIKYYGFTGRRICRHVSVPQISVHDVRVNTSALSLERPEERWDHLLNDSFEYFLVETMHFLLSIEASSYHVCEELLP